MKAMPGPLGRLGPLVLAVAAAAVLPAGCGPQVLEPGPRESIVRVVIEEDDRGLIDPAPAYEEAHAICSERLQTAIYFRGEDVGARERMLYFRCE